MLFKWCDQYNASLEFTVTHVNVFDYVTVREKINKHARD